MEVQEHMSPGIREELNRGDQKKKQNPMEGSPPCTDKLCSGLLRSMRK